MGALRQRERSILWRACLKRNETCSFRFCAASGSFPIKVKVVVPQRDAGSVDTNFLLQEEWVIRSRDTSED